MCAALSLVAIVPRNSHGQRVLGAGEDATVLPGGVVRWTVQVGWSAYNEVYAPGGPLERLAARYSSDSLGASGRRGRHRLRVAVTTKHRR